MNIPYADFYDSEVKGNDEDVDAVSSATLNKTRTGSLVGGSYHEDPEGSEIRGVTFPVRVKKGTDFSSFKKVTDEDSVDITVTNRGQTNTTTYKGKDALFENEDFAYYELSEVPSYYKELTVSGDVLTFSEVKGTAKNVSGVSATVSASSSYGDYQLYMTGLPESLSNDSTTVYGVVIHTKEGTDYGMRHLENIWRKTNIAWASGFTETTHGNELSPYHYESMMGQNITGVTYYTSEGTMEITFTDAVYVPVKFEQEISVAEGAKTDDIDVAVNGLDALPEDYDARYTVSGQDNDDSVMFTVVNGKMTWTGSPVAGKYTLKIEDQSGKYASVEVSFVLSTSNVPVQVQANEDGSYQLAATENASENQVKAYVKSITAVKVGDTTYAATGRGAVKIIKDDGTIDLSAKANGKYIFESEKAINISITATGYPQVDGTVTAPIRYQYVLMNIPYGEFYANELENNEVEVDAVSSATANTTHKASDKLYSAGSYHYDLTQINGVTYPVKAKAEDLKDFTAVESSDDLYQNQDHVYYILSEKPEYYKTLTSENGERSFSKVVTDQEATEYKIDTTLNTNVKHGDYELTMSGLGILNSNDTTVYGTILHTTNKAGETVDYGMRVVENIFKKKGPFELGWSSGLMKVGNKGCTLSYEHYESMIGNTITGFTAYTDHGTIEVTFENGLYVPEKFEVADFKIADASVEDSAQITGLDLPDDYAAEYVVTNADGEEMSGFEVKGDTITWPDDTEAGTYTLTVSDSNNKYFSFSTKFALIGNETQTGEAEVSVVNSKGTEFDNYTAKVSVVYDPVSGKIVSVADNATDYGDNDDFWQQALDAMVSWLKGKTVSDLKGKDVTEIDDVSGATCTAKGIKNAVLTALGAEPDTQSAELAAIMVSAAPAEVKFYKNEEVVKTVEVDADELDALGSLEILDVALDPKYEEDWNEFTVVVVDEEGNELENEATVVDDSFTVILADGREIVISFNFDTEEKKAAEEVSAADKAEEVSDSEVSDPEDTENEVKEEEKADDPSSDEENEDADAADDQDTKEKEDTEEAEDKSDESEENEDSAEDAASDDKEDALEVPEVGESTEGTTVEETETLSKDGE